MGSWWTSLCARCFYNTTPAVFPKAAAAVDANMFSSRLRFLSLYQHRPQAGQRDTRERHSKTRYLLQDVVEDTMGFCQRCWKIIAGTCSSNLFRSELRNSTGICASFLNVHETDRCMQDFMHAFFGSETLQVNLFGKQGEWDGSCKVLCLRCFTQFILGECLEPSYFCHWLICLPKGCGAFFVMSNIAIWPVEEDGQHLT